MGIKAILILIIPFCLFSQNNLLVDSLNTNFQNINHITSKYDSTYDFHVVFLLPFCQISNHEILDMELDSISEDSKISDFNVNRKSLISTDFLNGFLTYLNKINDVKFKISVYDIDSGENSKAIIDSLIKKRVFKNVDIVIGPLFTENFLYFSKRFNKKIPVISPFSKKSNIVSNNPYSIQIKPIIENQIKIFAKYILDEHKDDKIIVINRDTLFKSKRITLLGSDTLVIDTVVTNDVKLRDIFLNQIDTTSNIDYKNININKTVVDSIYHELDTLGNKNIVVIPSNDNVFVTDLLSKLHACRDTNLLVYGMPSSYNFNHLSVDDLMDLKLSFPHHGLDDSEFKKQFILEFIIQHNYISDLKYSLTGYEVGCYFISLLKKYGSIIPELAEDGPVRFVESFYDFKKLDSKGYINNGITILRYDDFGYKRLY